MSTEEALLHLVGSIYEAAVFPDQWVRVLDGMKSLTGGYQAGLMLRDLATHQYSLALQSNISPEAQRLYDTYYAARDEWFLRGQGILHAGWVGTGQMLCPENELIKTEFYNDLLRHHEMFHQCGIVVALQEKQMFAISLLRPKQCSAFGRRQVRLLKVLSPHLRRAHQLHYKATELRLRSAGAEWALDSWATGVLFVDASARVVLMNRSAADHIQKKNGLKLTREGVRASHPDESQCLEKLIRTAVRTANGQGFGSGGAMQLTCANSTAVSTVLVTPFRANGMFSPFRPLAAIFISDSNQTARPREQVFRGLFGLTPAEMRLSRLVAEGKGLREAANQLGVTYETARSQLKSIFGKTGTRRQGELVRLLLTLPME
jgi:DNA-binding CsgD family transcriptional regulator